jgi:ketosteroid isomerase-like protein
LCGHTRTRYHHALVTTALLLCCCLARNPRADPPPLTKIRAQIEEAGRRAAANYRDGRAVKFENFATCVTAELAYMLEIERFEAKVAGGDELTPVALRVTSIFRPEEGTWKLVHRHADPITTRRPGESVIQT